MNKVQFILTRDCNLNCIYCLQGNWNSSLAVSPIVPMDEKQLVSQFPGKGNFEVLFYGGEPFLEYERLLRLGHMLKNHNPEIKLSAVTNGTLLTVERAKELNSLGVHVTVSHDGYHFEKTRGIPDFLQTNPDPYLTLNSRGIAGTVSRVNYNYYDIWDYFLEFRKDHGLSKREAVRIILIEDAEGKTDESLLIKDFPEYERMLDDVFTNLESYLKIGFLDCFEYEQFYHMLKVLNFRMNHNGDICPYCGRGTVVCDMDIGGNIYTCPNSAKPITHVFEHGVNPIGKSKYAGSPECKACPAFIYCGGGCSAVSPARKEYECYLIKQQVSRLLRMLTNLCGGNP